MVVGLENQKTREEWLESTLKIIPSGSLILDAGAGELKYKKFCTHLSYVSHDFGRYDGKGNGAGLQTQVWDQSRLDIISDITDIPKENGSFDAVMCIEVLEHVPDPIKALKELVRLLHSSGYLITTAPFNSLTHFAPFFFYTGYSEYFYNYWLTEMGLKIIDIQVNGNYFEYLAQELNRLPKVARKYASQKFTWIERIASKVIVGSLSRFSSKDSGSSELLNFGFHVLAQKL